MSSRLCIVLALVAPCLVVAGCSSPEGEAPRDLMDETYIVIAPADQEDMPARIEIGGDTRRALAAALPSEFRYRVQVPERAFLTFSVAIISAPGADPAASLPGERIRFAVKAGEDNANELLFEREIHVGRRGRWIEQELDLGSFSGREVWLVFEASFPSAEESEVVPVLGVFGDPVLHDRARFRQGRGIVLVSIDTLRRDHVSVYGYPRRTTPGLEALATESVVFDDAISTSSWTLPAHASMLTSTYPSVHGAVNLNVGLAPTWPSLPTLLQDAGFVTSALVTHVYLAEEYGFGEGFSRHQYLPETRAEAVTDRAIQFLRSHGDRDFFLFVHYYDPHWHYDPPAPFDATFDPSYDGDASGVWWEFKELEPGTVDPRDLHHIEALYDGEILYTDRQVERLTREMKRLGVFDKSIIVVTSDHGEEFLDHGDWEHQKTLYEEQLRVPLLIKYPDGEQGGTRDSRQVSLIDVAPTIVDASGLTPPESFYGQSLRGSSDGPRELWAETEHTIDGTHKLSMRHGRSARKAIFSVGEDDVGIELYDLNDDPDELRALSLVDGPEGLDARLRSYLEGAARAREGKPETPSVELDPEEKRRLRALGYLK